MDGASLEANDCLVTHVHLNDRTVAGFRHVTKPIFAVQYHPEASPGPHDAAYLFDQFVALMGGDHGVGSISGDPAQASSTIEA